MSSARKASPSPVRSHWKPSAWQGIQLHAPPDWNMVAYGGDRREGNIRLDNSDPAAQAPLGMEMRWTTAKRPQFDADLEARVRQLFKNIEQTAKKTNFAASAETQPFRDTRHADRIGARSFSWRADRKAFGRIWYCPDCCRVVIAQVLGGLDADFEATARDLLSTIECHSSEPGWDSWALYDLVSQTPDDYQLKGKPQLMNIYVQLTFERERTADSLMIEQWSVANMQLRGMYLDEWFAKKNGHAAGEYHYEAEEATANGHVALALNGKRTGLQYWIAKLFPFRRTAIHYAARLWECPDSNKIYLVQSFSRNLKADLVDEIVRRTTCHNQIG